MPPPRFKESHTAARQVMDAAPRRKAPAASGTVSAPAPKRAPLVVSTPAGETFPFMARVPKSAVDWLERECTRRKLRSRNEALIAVLAEAMAK